MEHLLSATRSARWTWHRRVMGDRTSNFGLIPVMGIAVSPSWRVCALWQPMNHLSMDGMWMCCPRNGGEYHWRVARKLGMFFHLWEVFRPGSRLHSASRTWQQPFLMNIWQGTLFSKDWWMLQPVVMTACWLVVYQASVGWN